MVNARGEMPHPGVRFPPPFLFVGGFLIGWGLSRQMPLPLFPPTAQKAAIVAGLALGALGLALMIWGLATFRSHRTGIIPNRPATRIVREGPYRFTRNPMYTGMTIAYVGGVLLFGDVWPLLLLPIVLFLLVRLVIAREERYLASAFPDDYDAYCRDVRRWV